MSFSIPKLFYRSSYMFFLSWVMFPMCFNISMLFYWCSRLSLCYRCITNTGFCISRFLSVTLFLLRSFFCSLARLSACCFLSAEAGDRLFVGILSDLFICFGMIRSCFFLFSLVDNYEA